MLSTSQVYNRSSSACIYRPVWIRRLCSILIWCVCRVYCIIECLTYCVCTITVYIVVEICQASPQKPGEFIKALSNRCRGNTGYLVDSFKCYMYIEYKHTYQCIILKDHNSKHKLLLHIFDLSPSSGILWWALVADYCVIFCSTITLILNPLRARIHINIKISLQYYSYI